MITLDLNLLMNWLILLMAGLSFWVIIGLIAAGCEVKWGFPFDFGNTYSGSFRAGLAKDMLNKNPAINIFKGLPMLVLWMLANILLLIWYIFYYFPSPIIASIKDFFFNGFSKK